MNEDSKPTIDPELEARIVAMVLGEASDFEAEQLRQMIAESEPLAEFERELLAVDGLLRVVTESDSIDGGDWKLPTERRASVLAAIGGEQESGASEATNTAQTNTIQTNTAQTNTVQLAKPSWPTFMRSKRWMVVAFSAAVVVLMMGMLSLMQTSYEMANLAQTSEPSALQFSADEDYADMPMEGSAEGAEMGGEWGAASGRRRNSKRESGSAAVLSKNPSVRFALPSSPATVAAEVDAAIIADLVEVESLNDSVGSSKSALSAIRDSLGYAAPAKKESSLDASGPKGYFESMDEKAPNESASFGASLDFAQPTKPSVTAGLQAQASPPASGGVWATQIQRDWLDKLPSPNLPTTGAGTASATDGAIAFDNGVVGQSPADSTITNYMLQMAVPEVSVPQVESPSIAAAEAFNRRYSGLGTEESDAYAIPSGGPGLSATSPQDRDLYIDGHLEVPNFLDEEMKLGGAAVPSGASQDRFGATFESNGDQGGQTQPTSPPLSTLALIDPGQSPEPPASGERIARGTQMGRMAKRFREAEKEVAGATPTPGPQPAAPGGGGRMAGQAPDPSVWADLSMPGAGGGDGNENAEWLKTEKFKNLEDAISGGRGGGSGFGGGGGGFAGGAIAANDRFEESQPQSATRSIPQQGSVSGREFAFGVEGQGQEQSRLSAGAAIAPKPMRPQVNQPFFKSGLAQGLAPDDTPASQSAQSGNGAADKALSKGLESERKSLQRMYGQRESESLLNAPEVQLKEALSMFDKRQRSEPAPATEFSDAIGLEMRMDMDGDGMAMAGEEIADEEMSGEALDIAGKIVDIPGKINLNNSAGIRTRVDQLEHWDEQQQANLFAKDQLRSLSESFSAWRIAQDGWESKAKADVAKVPVQKGKREILRGESLGDDGRDRVFFNYAREQLAPESIRGREKASMAVVEEASIAVVEEEAEEELPVDTYLFRTSKMEAGRKIVYEWHRGERQPRIISNTPDRATVPEGLDEKDAAEEAFSTFSLHVSDVSFKLARAALAGGEWPEAAKVRIEEFVNAFDYGDPMPSRDETVACRLEQSAHPFLQQRNLLRVSMRTAAAGRSGATPLRLTLVLDNSGSMERLDRQQTVRRAFALLAAQLKPIDQVTLISFARTPRLLAEGINGAQAQQLVSLIDGLPSEGGTNLEAALQLAFEKATEQQVEGAQNRIILLTDGAVNLGNANPESLSGRIIAMRGAGIAFDAAGISANGLNDEVLEALTRKGDGRYYLLDSIDDCDDGFARQVAGALRPAAKNVKIQVEFNPRRVGRYKLLGFEKHRLKKEDFRNDKVDAAEMAAEEAGVAMYQFEAKPDGEGDIGSVSVRFRDLSTGQMIEKRWPIPYESDVCGLQLAPSPIKIASSAALFAAKLRGEPLGESVDLKTLAGIISSLPASDRSVRVEELQGMIQLAREIAGN